MDNIWPKTRADNLKADIRGAAEMAQLFKEHTTTQFLAPMSRCSQVTVTPTPVQKPVASTSTTHMCTYPHRSIKSKIIKINILEENKKKKHFRHKKIP